MKIGADDGDTPRWKFSTAQPVDEQRRSFLGTLLALGSLCVGALLAVPLIRFALFPLLRRTTELKASPVGSLTEFSSLSEPLERTIQIEQVDGWRKAVSEKAVYVTKNAQGELLVLSSICPHLGCTVPWVSDKREFICPCHGAVYAPDGARINGPCLRGMDTLETSEQDGQLLVRFQYFRQLVADKEVIG
jgi:menaquinol-cytochrome c reductase iron-sulfur subunit